MSTQNTPKDQHTDDNKPDLSLEEARKVVWDATTKIVSAFMERQEAMEGIANAKISEKGPSLSYSDLSVIRFDRENELLQRYENMAIENWEDPELVKMLIWYLMFAGKAKQLQILWKDSVYGKEYIDDNTLLDNLLQLTWRVAETYDIYWEGFGGTIMIRELETNFIREVAWSIWKKDIAIDLWSANGHIVRELQQIWFKNTIWYDICPEMLKQANAKSTGDNISFQEANLFEGIPHDNQSVDFIVSNFWSASEVNKDIIPEVDRVLRTWGKAVLSFYNSNSITQSWWQPLQNWIEPILNPKSQILEVPILDKDAPPKVYKLYAKPYSLDEIMSKITTSWLNLEKVWSFSPALTMTPPTFYDSKWRKWDLKSYEEQHYYTWPYVWFYINIIVSK